MRGGAAPAAVILAAGESKRMGSPKALLDAGGQTFLERLIDVFGEVCETVVVVTGKEHARIAAGTRNASRASMVVNEETERGQAWSLMCGLRAVELGVERVFFHPVDAPMVRAETVRRMAEIEAGALLVVPRCEGRRGHPVMACGDAVGMFREMSPGTTARDVVHTLRGRTVYVDVDDRGVLADVDTPEDYAALDRGGRA